MAFQKKRAPFDKVIKYVMEQIKIAVAPLDDVVRNQEIIIAQNKQMIELLGQIRDVRNSQAPSGESACSEEEPPAEQELPKE